jgi:hypothetical protein
MDWLATQDDASRDHCRSNTKRKQRYSRASSMSGTIRNPTMGLMAAKASS